MAKVRSWDTFILLLWKNWILQWHNKCEIAIDLLVPMCFILMLVGIRCLVYTEDVPTKKYPPLDIYTLKLFNGKLQFDNLAELPKFALFYSPKNWFLEEIVKDAAKQLQLEYKGYSSAYDLESALITTNPFAGIQFDDSMGNIKGYPEKLSITLRFPSELRTTQSILSWLTLSLYPDKYTVGPRNIEDTDGGTPVGYLREGFLPLQHALSMAYIKLAGKAKNLPKIELQRYPHPSHIYAPFLPVLFDILTYFLLLSFIYPCSSLTKYITSEKEKQLKEVMKIMGSNNWIQWAAWFVKALATLGIISILIATLLKVEICKGAAVLTHTSWTPLLFFLLIYSSTIICFCFVIASLFTKASTAAALTGLILFLTYLPVAFVMSDHAVHSSGYQLAWCLVCNTALGFAISAISRLEIARQGLQWNNMFSLASVDGGLSLGAVIIMMLISCVISIGLCLYIEQIYPGEFGVPKKWNFPFTKQFWCGGRDKGIEDMPKEELERRDPGAFEAEPSGKHVGLQVKNLKKKFGDKMAVRGVSMNMYEDEITVLLGHNGAGKTTTISMLTGMFPPTAGTAIINGSDIRTNTEGARKSLGICPQHNVLFDDMSVANHIVFFSRLKGLKGDAVKKEVAKYLKMIKLEDKANVASKKLSGGMKRKLSVCCALCGDTKVVLCDEPSSGLDPAARRQLWDLLQAEKTGRTLLLTTHFMDEADVLGDRIAIMSDGELKCYGTSFFLKKKYGSGYHLICVKREGCNVAAVTALLQQFIPGLQPESNISAELSYQLPDSYTPVFEEMFGNLEESSDDLKLNGYGISISSMEEVFMKVGVEDTKKEAFIEQHSSMRAEYDFLGAERPLKGCNLFCNQWHAMFMKRFWYTCQNKMLFLLQNIMAIIFVIITIVSARSEGTFSVLEPMTISLSQYPTAITVLEVGPSVEDGSLEARVANQYRSIATSYGSKYMFASTGEQNFQDYILDLERTIQVRVNSQYLAAATVSKGKIIAWLNNQPLHTAPLTVNMVHNAMAKVLISPRAEIIVINYPLPYSHKTIVSQLRLGHSLGTNLSINLCFCMCLISALYIILLIKERSSRSKLLQYVGGVNVWVFWLTQLICDFGTFIFTVFLVLFTLACFHEEGYSTFYELGRILLLFCTFALAMLPLTYLISLLYDDPANGFARLLVINTLAGMGLFLVMLIIPAVASGTKQLENKLQRVFRLVPHCSLALGLHKMYVNYMTRRTCNNHFLSSMPLDLRCEIMPQCCKLVSFLDWEEPGILPELMYMLIVSLLLSLILMIWEYRWMQFLIYNIRKCFSKPKPEDGVLDEDVQLEKKRILAMSSKELSKQNLVLDRVTKYYGNFLAVNQVSLCVRKNECFGLLGVNGAGKTSIFKMMTGDERISSGVAYVKGMKLHSKMNKIYKEIGYCPQFDAFLDELTGRETLQIFCLLRGIHKSSVNDVSEELAESFGFLRHVDKSIKSYSGGNKRKLSTAIAVIGSPSVIYLDEPTSGMDPAARRQLWNMMCSIRDAGKSIVLTSHSMEECEALCTRLAIMVNGEFKCIGSTQHLKNRFSKGLILKVKVKRDLDLIKQASRKSMNYDDNEHLGAIKQIQEDIDNAKEFVSREFPESILQEDYQGILTFYIPLSSIKWSKMFGFMERNRERLNIEDYSISQTTLEEIFLEFAKYQREDPRSINTKKRRICCSCWR